MNGSFKNTDWPNLPEAPPDSDPASATGAGVQRSFKWGLDFPFKAMTDAYVLELETGLRRWHQAQQDAFDEREKALQERELEIAETGRAMQRGERKLVLAWEEFSREQDSMTQMSTDLSGSKTALHDTESRLNQTAQQITTREAQVELAQRKIEMRQQQLDEGERALAESEKRLVESWESLYQEQEALAKRQGPSLASNLSDRATDLVHREQGVADTATKLAAAMAAFSRPDEHREQALAAREKAVLRREEAIALREQELETRQSSCVQGLASGSGTQTAAASQSPQNPKTKSLD